MSAAGDISYFTSGDGLRLAVHCFGDARSSGPPVICLPGQSRTARDFLVLARALAGPAARRVLIFESRGRGRSDWDPDPSHYTPQQEAADLLIGLDAWNIARAALVGTSRGGIVAALAAALRPGLVARAVLNDVGPVLELSGLLEIKAYLGPSADPPDWASAIAVLKARHGGRFTALSDDEWSLFARQVFADRDGRPVADYDPKLAGEYARIDETTVLPAAWALYDSLQTVPTLLIRGANSALLSAGTAADMISRYPLMRLVTVPGQGHAPVFLKGPLLDQVVSFLAERSAD